MIERQVMELLLKEVRFLNGRRFLLSKNRLSDGGPDEEDSEQR